MFIITSKKSNNFFKLGTENRFFYINLIITIINQLSKREDIELNIKESKINPVFKCHFSMA